MHENDMMTFNDDQDTLLVTHHRSDDKTMTTFYDLEYGQSSNDLELTNDQILFENITIWPNNLIKHMERVHLITSDS